MPKIQGSFGMSNYAMAWGSSVSVTASGAFSISSSKASSGAAGATVTQLSKGYDFKAYNYSNTYNGTDNKVYPVYLIMGGYIIKY